MYSDKPKIQRKAAEKSLQLQGRKQLCYLSNTFTCLQNKHCFPRQHTNQRNGLHILLLSSHQVFHGSSSAEFASEKPHSIYEASLRVQHSCCNIFLTGNNLQQYFEGISDQVYPSKQDPQELWTKSYCLVHQAMPLLKFKGKEISPNSSEHQEALVFCLFVFS